MKKTAQELERSGFSTCHWAGRGGDDVLTAASKQDRARFGLTCRELSTFSWHCSDGKKKQSEVGKLSEAEANFADGHRT